MHLNHTSMRLIRAALTHRHFNATELLLNKDFLAEVSQKAARIYSNEQCTRSFDEVVTSTLLGELGEHALTTLLQRAGLDVEHNDEERTLEYNWDLKVEGLKGEVKFQGDGFDSDSAKEYFSFNTEDKDRTMREAWRSYDFILAFYVIVVPADLEQFEVDQTLIVPWLLVDSEVINPEHQLYVKSNFNAGFFLKMNRAKLYYADLNTAQRSYEWFRL